MDLPFAEPYRLGGEGMAGYRELYTRRKRGATADRILQHLDKEPLQTQYLIELIIGRSVEESGG